MRHFPFRHRRRPTPPGGHGRVVVRLHGDLDNRNAESTGRRLVESIDSEPAVVEVDLTHVRYLSPDGCGAFIMALRAARTHGTRLLLTHAHERAQATLHQTGLLRALDELNRGEGTLP